MVLLRKADIYLKYLLMKCSTLLLLAVSPLFARSQNLHADIFAGVANYQGDLQGKRFTFSQAHPAVGIGLSYDITARLIARTGFTYGTIEGNDQKNSAGKGIELRNLRFKSRIAELQLGLEYNIFDLGERSFTPYLFAGVAGYHFNPYTTDATGNKVFLRPLHTEGQGLDAYPDKKQYSLTQFAIPFGGGLKLAINDNLQVGLEIGLRKLFTDYLDDVSTTYADSAILANNVSPQAAALAYRGDEIDPSSSYPAEGAQRGNSKYKDWYYFTGLRISYRLGSGKNSDGSRNRVGCPRNIY